MQSRVRLGSSVTLKPQTVDRFARTVAEVIGKVNINLALVEDGMAFAYRQYLAQCDAKEHLDAEFRASLRRTGVWRVPGGITRPSDFRRTRRSSGGSGATSQRAAPAGSAPGSLSGQRDRCRAIGRFPRAQELLRQGHNHLDGDGDGDGDGVACESLR
ncbi:MAG: thermonuclease family protein [Prochlorococcaceae cyanobacterium]